ncbi:biotin--[acetyl-CoA-carboxylase] ligase [Brevibacillus fluminis]|uniref:Bifunctional ligase/repressor BirA n=1 Tax=Brevibacillus fluminis TaxID=511487 RepID=A0A3M8D0R3_9BACL|nr:biotin--[acetyl-CoA-carboxylase] ligase [Brevibacillus fluminis]RNB81664.1 biotin--[acetyl-CoA-carboxylase] ligase [Brevibacillus fluminis]
MNIKQAILNAFREHPDQFISGEELSRNCGCSRTAVWKHIEELREEGYQFEAVRKSGYRLLNVPDSISAEQILSGLTTKKIGRHIYAYDTVETTQRLAHEAAAQGAEEGTIIIADQQNGGKGRMGRPWHSPKGAGIFMSLIIRPDMPLANAPQLTLLTAVAMSKAIEMVVPSVKVQIKWPNDLFVHGKKICGILTELNAEENRVNYLVIGTGVNVNHLLSDFPESLHSIATSLRIESGSSIQRAELVQAYCRSFERELAFYLENGFARIREEWEANSYTLGRVVKVYNQQNEIEGRAVGLGLDGALLVEDAEGYQHQVYSADLDYRA